jgi:hypothetical protein
MEIPNLKSGAGHPLCRCGLGWQAIFYPALLGFLWGIAQTTFSLSINALGMAIFSFHSCATAGC